MDTRKEPKAETDTETTAAATVKGKRLTLKRETLHHLNDQLLTSQGHSLWTCDITTVAKD